MRRILLFSLILFLVGGAAWFFFGRNTDPQTEEGQSGFKSFFPIGGGTVVPGEDPTAQQQEAAAPGPTERYVQVSSRPIAGYTVFSNIVRFVSRANGFVYEVIDQGGELTTPLQISNIFIPNIYEANFVDNNKTVLLRFLRPDERTIATYSVPIPDPNPDNTRTQKEGSYLPDGISSLVISPSTTKVARLTGGALLGIVTTTTSTNKTPVEILRVPFKEWLLQWPSEGSIYAQTKAAATADGFLYAIDQKNKQLKKVLGDIAGLTTSVSPSGTYIIYSRSIAGGFTTHIYNTKTGLSQPLNLSILPEKCVWLKTEDLICAVNISVESAVYPDAWYAGVTRFSDRLYRIYPQSNTFDAIDSSEVFDMVDLKVDSSNQYLFFINKYTGQLWRFRL